MKNTKNQEAREKICHFFYFTSLTVVKMFEEHYSTEEKREEFFERKLKELQEKSEGIENEELKQNIVSILERMIMRGEAYYEDLETGPRAYQTLQEKVTDFEKVPDEQFKAQIHFFRGKYPSQLEELEKKLGAENITMDNFTQFLANKEWKARYGKWEVEQQKDRQIKLKNKINSKYQNQLRNLQKLKQGRQDAIDKLETTKDELQKSQLEVQQQINKYNQTKQEVREYEIISAELAGELNKNKTHLDLAHKDIQRLRKKLTQAKKAKSKLVINLQRLDKSKKETKVKEKIVTQSYRLQRNEIRQQNQQDHAIFRDNIQAKRSEINSLTGQISSLSKKLGGVAIDSGKKSRQLTQLKRARALVISDLNNQLSSKETLITNLIQKKEQIQQDYDQLKNNYNSLDEQSQTSLQELAKKEQKVKRQQKTIQRLRTEKQQWKQNEQELLAEIELLKNPPQQANKENLQVETNQYQEQVKELVKKLPVEQIKTINLLLQEQQNKFNQQLQVKENLLNKVKVGRERERETKILLWILTMVIIIAIGELVLLVRKSKRKRLK